MSEQQKRLKNGTIVKSLRPLRSPRAAAEIPAGSVGLVTGRHYEAWLEGDPLIRVNFGPYGLKLVHPAMIEELNVVIAGPDVVSPPESPFLWDALVRLSAKLQELEAELAALKNGAGASTAHADSSTGC
ncbi:MAG: hypothetical protein WCZ87_00200 [Thiohalobacteraceae bacterium]